MDIKTGQILEFGSIEEKQEYEKTHKKKLVELEKEEAERLKKMTKFKRKNFMRNRPCVCGSKKKFKNCCWRLYG